MTEKLTSPHFFLYYRQAELGNHFHSQVQLEDELKTAVLPALPPGLLIISLLKTTGGMRCAFPPDRKPKTENQLSPPGHPGEKW
jgi:hypothetical protein